MSLANELLSYPRLSAYASGFYSSEWSMSLLSADKLVLSVERDA